ncbi:hypothetical protein FQA39_LY01409 [Lamprigera yunnana]|nr:hypothetical protein FQA39_LY01409 [Lamprigera yunnana]
MEAGDPCPIFSYLVDVENPASRVFLSGVGTIEQPHTGTPGGAQDERRPHLNKPLGVVSRMTRDLREAGEPRPTCRNTRQFRFLYSCTQYVAVIDLTVRLGKSATYEGMKAKVKGAAEESLDGILGYT